MRGESRMKKQIRKYLFENFIYNKPDDWLKNDDSFLDNGIIDSTGVLELVTFVEEVFQIQVEDEDIVPDNFDSVNNLYSYINNKKEAYISSN